MAPGVRLLDPLGREIEAGAPPDDHPPGDYPHPCPGDHAHPSCRRPHGRPHHTGDNPPLSRAPSHHLGRRADRGARCRCRATCRWPTTASSSWMHGPSAAAMSSRSCASHARGVSAAYNLGAPSISPHWPRVPYWRRAYRSPGDHATGSRYATKRGVSTASRLNPLCSPRPRSTYPPPLAPVILSYDANHRAGYPLHASRHPRAEPLNRDRSCPQARSSTAPLAARHATFPLTPWASLYRLAPACHNLAIHAICPFHWRTGGRADDVYEHLPVGKSSRYAWPLCSIPLPGEAPAPDPCLTPSHRKGLLLLRPPLTSQASPAVAGA
jgi:hypothetical protein